MKLLVKSFKYDEYEVLRDIDMRFNKGKISLLLGPSGCGKSTLLNIISDKKEYSISYATQDIRLLEKFKVIDNVVLGLKEVDYDKLKRNAEILKISDLLDKKSSLLSGGERQRVTILRALMNNSEYILLDEPTSNLDQNNGHNLLVILQALVKQNNIGVIITSHEGYVKQYCDVIYEYNNYNFTLIEGDIQNTKDIKRNSSSLEKISSIKNKYYFKYFFNNFVFRICLLVIMIISTLLILGMNTYFQNDYDLYYDSLDDNTIVIEQQHATSSCEDDECSTAYDFSDITFSEEEISDLSSIEGVSSVSTAGLSTSMNIDSEGNKVAPELVPAEFFDDPQMDYLVDIRKEIINRSQNYDEYKVEDAVSYHFVGVTQDINTINGYGYASEYYHLNNMLYGTNVLNNSDEIIIPYSLALYISYVSGYGFEEIIGQYIPIEVQNYNTGEIHTKEYKVVGIYDEAHTKNNNELGNIYIQGTPDLSSDYLYSQLSATFGSNEKFSSLYPDLGSFKVANDSGITTVVLTIDENYDEIYNQVTKEYSDANIITKEQFQEEYFKEYKLRSTIFSIVTLCITLITYIFLSKIIFSLFIKKKVNDIRVFSIIGYNNKEISHLYKSMLLYDLLICLIIGLVIIQSVMVIILFLLSLLVLKTTKLSV